MRHLQKPCTEQGRGVWRVMKDKEQMNDFHGLKLADPILKAIAESGYETPTPIQARTIPALMNGRDVLGVAQTGTGKTAAFALPLLHRLAQSDERPRAGRPRALILAPTRELAGQIHDSLRTYGKHLRLRAAVIFGGVSANPQIRALRQGLHVLVATPGRLMDLMNQGHVRLDAVEVFILDEADRMLDMGFIPDIRRICAKLPGTRQTVLFSATMPRAVRSLADGLLDDPEHVEVASESTPAQRVAQSVRFVDKGRKVAALTGILADEEVERVIVFTRTKHCANKVVRKLAAAGVSAEAIHGNKSQNARMRALKGFRDGRIRALVATDIAARGIDVPEVTHVINFELPDEPESYVHRIGRTARAGRAGMAISLCDLDDRMALRDIERTMRANVPVDDDHDHHDEDIAQARGERRKQGGRGQGRGRGRGKAGGAFRRRARRPARQGARAGA